MEKICLGESMELRMRFFKQSEVRRSNRDRKNGFKGKEPKVVELRSKEIIDRLMCEFVMERVVDKLMNKTDEVAEEAKNAIMEFSGSLTKDELSFLRNIVNIQGEYQRIMVERECGKDLGKVAKKAKKLLDGGCLSKKQRTNLGEVACLWENELNEYELAVLPTLRYKLATIFVHPIVDWAKDMKECIIHFGDKSSTFLGFREPEWKRKVEK